MEEDHVVERAIEESRSGNEVHNPDERSVCVRHAINQRSTEEARLQNRSRVASGSRSRDGVAEDVYKTWIDLAAKRRGDERKEQRSAKSYTNIKITLCRLWSWHRHRNQSQSTSVATRAKTIRGRRTSSSKNSERPNEVKLKSQTHWGTSLRCERDVRMTF